MSPIQDRNSQSAFTGRRPPATFPLSHFMNARPLIIGIAGGSGSGKSTVARNVGTALGAGSMAAIDMDGYYKNFAHLPFEERKAINWDHPDAFDWDLLLDGAELLHLSGITPALGPRSAEAALAAAQATRARGVKVSFDGNYRAQLWRRWDSDPKTILSELVGMADILFGNHRDMSLLLGREFGGEGEGRRREAAEAAFSAFPNLQLIASTARHMDDADRHRISARIDAPDGAFQTEEVVVAGIVDRIGAGDAFAAGVLHGLLTGQDRELIARSGLALACLKHSLPGDASLFTQADIDAFLSGELDVRR